MSETGKTLMGTFGMTDFLMPMVLEDLSDADARTRSRGDGGPSITWLVGHLLHYRYFVLNLLGDERESPFGETFTEDATDGSDYPSIAEIHRHWAELAPDFQAALETRTEADWEASGAGPHEERTAREQVVFFAWHEGYHMGCLGAMRKAMGKPGPAEKVMAMREAEAAAET